MTDPAPDPRDDTSLFPKSAGERLRAARAAQGLSLADVAARTRIPIRHLEAIESGDYSSLPTPTYAIGFAKAYARAVGEDEATIARDVRGKTAATARERREYQPYAIDDPARVPPRGLALAAAAIAVLVLIGAAIWFGTDWFRGDDQAQPTAVVAAPTTATAPPVASMPVPAPAGAGEVTLTALDRVWVRVRDASGKALFENTMNAGDHFTVPPDADHPVLSIGRPDKLRLTLNGAALPPLGSGGRAMKDVPIDATALAARRGAAIDTRPNPTDTQPTPNAAPSATPIAQPRAASVSSPAAHHDATPRARPTAKPAKRPLKLDLKPTPPPVPAPSGIY